MNKTWRVGDVVCCSVVANFKWPQLPEILPYTWLNHAQHGFNLFTVNRIEQPIDRIDIDTPTLDKQQTHVFP